MKHLPHAFLLLVLFLAACDLIPDLPAPAPDPGNTGPTPTPLPTSTSPQFPTVADRSCQLATLAPMRVDPPQGDLLAWRPNSLDLAYVGPAQNSNWYAGVLYQASGPDFAEPIQLAPGALAFGTLAWSPDGFELAFVGWRLSDHTYTILTAPAGGGTPQDWLPGDLARTSPTLGGVGALSSRKVILDWPDEDTIRFLTACGSDCDNIMRLDTATGSLTQEGEQIRHSLTALDVRNNQNEYDEDEFPYMITPNWSPDLSKVAYLDEDDRVMVLLVDEQVQYILETGVVMPRETRWASDNRTLAVRTDDVIYIFDTECNQ